MGMEKADDVARRRVSGSSPIALETIARGTSKAKVAERSWTAYRLGYNVVDFECDNGQPFGGATVRAMFREELADAPSQFGRDIRAHELRRLGTCLLQRELSAGFEKIQLIDLI
jgi:hypothetical protein